MPATSSKYHRPSYLRSLELYEALKKTYDYGRGFVVVRSVAPMAERLVEVRRGDGMPCESERSIHRTTNHHH